MYKLGLKLWSVNTDSYYNEAIRLYNKGIFDYIELYVVPNSLSELSKWKRMDIPFIIHSPHSAHGFNLAMADKTKTNLEIYKQVRLFADELNAQYIIFHGGTDGKIEETVKQLSSFHEPRVLIENKPYLPLPGNPNVKVCRGSTIDELKYILNGVGCGLCLDIGHAVCSANYQGKDPYAYIKELLCLKPKIFHLSDISDIRAVYDSHYHLGTGCLDIARLKREIFTVNSVISIETIKDNKDNLNDFEKDVQWLKSIG